MKRRAVFTAIDKEGKDLGDFNEAAGPWRLSAGAVADLTSNVQP